MSDGSGDSVLDVLLWVFFISLNVVSSNLLLLMAAPTYREVTVPSTIVLQPRVILS